jgi:iron(III) transport system ATP-binding protein
MFSIKLEQVSKTYGSNPPTITMDANIPEGEFFTLLGPSGCGKSTMLRMIAGFITPTSGRIRFGERDVTTVSPSKRDTGMVFQNYALFPHMSVADNVAYGLKVRRVNKAERTERITAALATVGLTGYGDRRIDELSGGQQQRVALARAIVISPSLLLLDEPLSNLDAKLREETRLQIRDVQRKSGITALYVTHDQAEAMAMSDRIAVLEGGRVHQVGAPRDIYQRPATTFVARFIGNSNVLPGTVTRVDGETATVRLSSKATVTVPRDPEQTVEQGQKCSVSMRPELMRFTTNGNGLFTGTVHSLEYTGASVSYEVVGADTTVTVTVPDHDAVAAVDDVVTLGGDTDRAWLVTS